MIRKATIDDIDAIENIYNKIHTNEEKGLVTIGWIRDVYPTRQVAIDALNNNELFVLEDNNQVVASAKINQVQVPEYKNASWEHNDGNDKVMVLHTLVVDPDKSGNGYGKEFVKFYEQYSLQHNCPCLRMDTNKNNTIARALYKKLGYKEVGVVPCDFNGIKNIGLVCLEKYLG